LSVTQSAVSQSLAKLEAELGVQLFVRRHRALAPTPAANSLFPVIAAYVESLETTIADIQRARHELSGLVRLGAPVELGARRLPALLASFRRDHPGARFEVSLGHPSQIVPRVREGDLDLAFADMFDTGPAAWAGLDVAPLVEEQLVLVGSRATERAHLDGRRTFRELSACPFVAYHSNAPDVRGWFRHHFDKIPTRFEVVLAVESVQAVLAAVGEHLGFGLLPADAVAHSMHARKLVLVETRRRPMTHRISLVRLLDKVPSRLERAFVRHVEATEWRMSPSDRNRIGQ
jgi:DNA-binding transcriptional LysR family regulator